MAEVAFRPVRQLSEYKGKGASASRELYNKKATKLNFNPSRLGGTSENGLRTMSEGNVFYYFVCPIS